MLCIESAREQSSSKAPQIMEASNSHRLVLLLLSVLLSSRALVAGVTNNTFGKGRNITDGEVCVSNNGGFTLGFFSPDPGAPTKRYLGIWFTADTDAVYWVANGDRPLTDNSGALVVSNMGTLLLLDGTGQIAWSSNSTGTSSAVVAQLLDNGNLVVGNQGSSTVLWQSFDHPTNTMLPGMKVGKSLWTGVEWYLTSWSSVSDPSTGEYRCVLETSGLPDFFVWKGNVKVYRTGPWNGRWFSGVPEESTYANLITFEVSTGLGETSYGYVAEPGAPPSRLMVTDSGMVKRLFWDMSRRSWLDFFQGPRDACDEYGKCGEFGLCDSTSAPYCNCLKGFSMSGTSRGCRRNIALNCEAGGMSTTDGFWLVPGVKLPDTHNASVDSTIAVEECRARCIGNCSCLAYAAADIRGGGSGCIIWTDSIIDLRRIDRGQDLYLKLSGSEFDEVKHLRFLVAIIAPVASSVAIVLLVLMVWWIRRRKLTGVAPQVPPMTIPPPILLSDLPTIKEATGDFSVSSEIGRGGFAVVYKGELADGTMIAVKRFNQSALTSKGRSDFTREVDVMARIRHGNLLRLLDHCNDGEECILIYPYMANQSLDRYIFGDPSLRAALNWRQRLDIIQGVAQGVAYLHHGLEESVIHRDLKPHNVLLDDNFKPKVSDFNTAKLFVDNQPDTDSTLVLTPGYASPEYVQGELTLKCDVYSFGVMLLETLAGQKNGAAQRLLPHAWELWGQGAAAGLLDPTVSLPQSVPDSEVISDLERCIQIGLLCVQEIPDDRPAMSDVVVMLMISKTSQIDRPNRPALHGRTGPPLRVADILSPTGSADLT